MANTKGFFQTTQHASEYKKFRSEMPPDIVKKIIDFLSKQFTVSQCIGVDVGCGSGQSTLPLAPYLSKIIGVDVSEAQLAEIKKDPRSRNIEFKKGTAESLPLGNESVHLVVAMHSAHWFDFPKFLEEVDRILVPGGILAIGDAERRFIFRGFEAEVDELFEELKQSSSKYWTDSIRKKDDFYKQMVIPYKEFQKKPVPVIFTTSVAFFIGRVKTVSVIAKFLEDEPENAEKAMQIYQEKLMNLISAKGSPEDTDVTYTKMYNIMLGRKPYHIV